MKTVEMPNCCAICTHIVQAVDDEGRVAGGILVSSKGLFSELADFRCSENDFIVVFPNNTCEKFRSET